MTYRELEEAANRLAHLLAGHGVGPGRVCGAAVFAFGRGDRGDFGGAQDRGGVSADRPGAAGGADRVHARRCRADRRDHHRRAGRRGSTGVTWWSSMSTTPRSTPSPAPRCRRRRARGHRLHHLHLGHYRGAQGRGGHPPQRDPVVRLAGCRRAAGAGTGVDAVSFLRVRLSRCGRSGVRCCTVGGWWWCPSRWPARRKTSTSCWSLNKSVC